MKRELDIGVVVAVSKVHCKMRTGLRGRTRSEENETQSTGEIFLRRAVSNLKLKFAACFFFFVLIQFFGEICTFHSYDSSSENLCITKQLNQEDSAMQQGSHPFCQRKRKGERI